MRALGSGTFGTVWGVGRECTVKLSRKMALREIPADAWRLSKSNDSDRGGGWTRKRRRCLFSKAAMQRANQTAKYLRMLYRRRRFAEARRRPNDDCGRDLHGVRRLVASWKFGRLRECCERQGLSPRLLKVLNFPTLFYDHRAEVPLYVPSDVEYRVRPSHAYLLTVNRTIKRAAAKAAAKAAAAPPTANARGSASGNVGSNVDPVIVAPYVELPLERATVKRLHATDPDSTAADLMSQRVATQLLFALHAFHAVGLTCSDLKVDNLLLDSATGDLRMIDYLDSHDLFHREYDKFRRTFGCWAKTSTYSFGRYTRMATRFTYGEDMWRVGATILGVLTWVTDLAEERAQQQMRHSRTNQIAQRAGQIVRSKRMSRRRKRTTRRYRGRSTRGGRRQRQSGGGPRGQTRSRGDIAAGGDEVAAEVTAKIVPPTTAAPRTGTLHPPPPPSSKEVWSALDRANQLHSHVYHPAQPPKCARPGCKSDRAFFVVVVGDAPTEAAAAAPPLRAYCRSHVPADAQLVVDARDGAAWDRTAAANARLPSYDNAPQWVRDARGRQSPQQHFEVVPGVQRDFERLSGYARAHASLATSTPVRRRMHALVATLLQYTDDAPRRSAACWFLMDDAVAPFVDHAKCDWASDRIVVRDDAAITASGSAPTHPSSPNL